MHYLSTIYFLLKSFLAIFSENESRLRLAAKLTTNLSRKSLMMRIADCFLLTCRHMLSSQLILLELPSKGSFQVTRNGRRKSREANRPPPPTRQYALLNYCNGVDICYALFAKCHTQQMPLKGCLCSSYPPYCYMIKHQVNHNETYALKVVLFTSVQSRISLSYTVSVTGIHCAPANHEGDGGNSPEMIDFQNIQA